MSGYIGINLKEMIDQIGENEVKNILSDFSCPLNANVEIHVKTAFRIIPHPKNV